MRQQEPVAREYDELVSRLVHEYGNKRVQPEAKITHVMAVVACYDALDSDPLARFATTSGDRTIIDVPDLTTHLGAVVAGARKEQPDVLHESVRDTFLEFSTDEYAKYLLRHDRSVLPRAASHTLLTHLLGHPVERHQLDGEYEIERRVIAAREHIAEAVGTLSRHAQGSRSIVWSTAFSHAHLKRPSDQEAIALHASEITQYQEMKFRLGLVDTTDPAAIDVTDQVHHYGLDHLGYPGYHLTYEPYVDDQGIVAGYNTFVGISNDPITQLATRDLVSAR